MHCIRFNVFSEVINICQYVSVASLSARKQAHNVHRNSLERCICVYQNKRSAVAKNFFVPIAIRAPCTPVLDVFSDLQHINPLVEFFDDLVNCEVVDCSRAVCSFNYLLPRRARDLCFQGRLGSVADKSTQTQHVVLGDELVESRSEMP